MERVEGFDMRNENNAGFRSLYDTVTLLVSIGSCLS